MQACSDVTLTFVARRDARRHRRERQWQDDARPLHPRPDRADRGEVIFEGRDLTKLDKRALRALRTDLQIVFQEPFDSLNPQMTVGRQIVEPLRIHEKLGRRERRAGALELVRMVGLPPSVADAIPKMLSPGALQRASIARAIATEPKLIVLDEPTSALPPEAELEVIALLKDLQRRLGLTYIFISHDLSLVRSHLRSRRGDVPQPDRRERASGTSCSSMPRHPYSRALLASVLVPDPQRSGEDLSDRGERLEGEIPSPIDLPKGCYLASRCPYVRDRCRAEPQQLLPTWDTMGTASAAGAWSKATSPRPRSSAHDRNVPGGQRTIHVGRSRPALRRRNDRRCMSCWVRPASPVPGNVAASHIGHASLRVELAGPDRGGDRRGGRELPRFAADALREQRGGPARITRDRGVAGASRPPGTPDPYERIGLVGSFYANSRDAATAGKPRIGDE